MSYLKKQTQFAALGRKLEILNRAALLCGLCALKWLLRIEKTKPISGSVGKGVLWTLKWRRIGGIAGPWTKGGLVRTNDWPEWMSSFRD